MPIKKKKFLSEKYKLILQCWARGIKSPKEIARETGLNPSTVAVYLMRLRKAGILKPIPDIDAIEIHVKESRQILDLIIAEFKIHKRLDQRKLTELSVELERIAAIVKSLKKSLSVINLG